LNTTQKLTHWHEAINIATKVMVFGAAGFAVQYAGEINSIPLEQWVYPQNREDGFHDLAATKNIMDFFINHIGPYSYEKLANVQSKTKYGGMENASNIFYMEAIVDGKADHDDLIAHEIAHQWFGNSASETDWHHVWLSEGFASYFTHLYNEFTYGRDKRETDMMADRAAVIKFYKEKPLPIVFTSLPADLLEILSTNSYQKGSWVLHMLRTEIGDEAFWKGIRAYYKKYQNANAQTTDFKKEMEIASGKDLTVFFDQWLFRAGHPVLNSSWDYDSKTKTLSIIMDQTQTEQAFNFPLEIGIYSQNEHSPTIEKVRIDKKSSKLKISFPSKPLRIELDPHVNLLFDGKLKN
jgi:aminopeptidase N